MSHKADCAHAFHGKEASMAVRKAIAQDCSAHQLAAPDQNVGRGTGSRCAIRVCLRPRFGLRSVHVNLDLASVGNRWSTYQCLFAQRVCNCEPKGRWSCWWTHIEWWRRWRCREGRGAGMASPEMPREVSPIGERHSYTFRAPPERYMNGTSITRSFGIGERKNWLQRRRRRRRRRSANDPCAQVDRRRRGRALNPPS